MRELLILGSVTVTEGITLNKSVKPVTLTNNSEYVGKYCSVLKDKLDCLQHSALIEVMDDGNLQLSSQQFLGENTEMFNSFVQLQYEEYN